MRPKDKLGRPESTGVVYYLPCSGTNGTPCAEDGRYMGKTERTVASRISELFSMVRISDTLKLAVMAHAWEENHHFCCSDLCLVYGVPKLAQSWR